jgi:hypothetical protein
MARHRRNLKNKDKGIKDETGKKGLTVQDISGILAIWPIPDKDFVHPSA